MDVDALMGQMDAQKIEYEDREKDNLERLQEAAEHVMEIAKEIIRDESTGGDLPPAVFFAKLDNESREIIMLCTPGVPMGNEHEKNISSMLIRTFSRILNADAVVFASDSFSWKFDHEKIKKEFGDIEKFVMEKWSLNPDKEWRMQYAECGEVITVSVDSHWGRILLRQEYKRDDKHILFGEFDEEVFPLDDPNCKAEGRFVELLGSRLEKPNG